GGIYIELFKDVSIRLAPVTKAEALEMIRELKAARLFEGFRGKEPLDANAFSDVIVTLSHAIASIEEISDIECNPVMVYSHGCMAVDARIFLQTQKVASPTSW
ncbi:MAG TPA: acetate--CoA ligase family protein, partial [Spirochaetota bacterium]|nr:acetate--CoA ligase family protein [Spirochaetota bacterium]